MPGQIHRHSKADSTSGTDRYSSDRGYCPGPTRLPTTAAAKAAATSEAADSSEFVSDPSDPRGGHHSDPSTTSAAIGASSVPFTAVSPWRHINPGSVVVGYWVTVIAAITAVVVVVVVVVTFATTGSFARPDRAFANIKGQH